MVDFNLFTDPNFYINGKLFTQNAAIFTYNAAMSYQHTDHLYAQIQILAYKTHEIGIIFSIGGKF
jgi:hypothetical protein